MSAREEAAACVKRVGVMLCSYSVGPEWALPCDCKYGTKSDWLASERIYCGEQTGCPELRDAYQILTAMTDEEYDAVQARIHTEMAEAWARYREEHPDAR